MDDGVVFDGSLENGNEAILDDTIEESEISLDDAIPESNIDDSINDDFSTDNSVSLSEDSIKALVDALKENDSLSENIDDSDSDSDTDLEYSEIEESFESDDMESSLDDFDLDEFSESFSSALNDSFSTSDDGNLQVEVVSLPEEFYQKLDEIKSYNVLCFSVLFGLLVCVLFAIGVRK